MPDQSEHEKIENLVDGPGQAERSARTLQQAVDSHQSLEGYEAMNQERLPEESEAKNEAADSSEKP